MSDDARELLRRAFGAPVLSRYGALEFTSMVACTCPEGGWHVNSLGFIVEIVDGAFGDRAGNPSSRGRVLITDLRNRVMPFIRYEIGDVGWVPALASSKCACGATVLPLGGIEGRASDYVITVAGRRVPALVLQRVMRVQADLLWEYQFRQQKPSEVEVWVVPKREYSRTAAAALAEHVEASLDHEIRVAVNIVRRIPREPSGKRPILKTSLAGQTNSGAGPQAGGDGHSQP